MLNQILQTKFHSVKGKKAPLVALLILLSLLPFLWLLTQGKTIVPSLSRTANVAGFIGATLLLWQFLLGIRFISRNVTSDYVTITRFHIFLGTFGTLFVFLHPILQVFVYAKSLKILVPTLGTEWGISILAGQVAFGLFIILWLSSVFLRRKMAYRPWLYIHYISYPLMFLMFIHSRSIGTYFSTNSLINSYWQLLSGIFILIVGYRLARFLNIGKARYQLINKEKRPDNITLYTFQSKNKGITPSAGQFVYLRSGFFSEAHPFSVMEYDEDNRTLTFGIKAVGPYTNHLEKLKKGDTIFVDGPYGIFTREGHNSQPKVLIAGGIGITPFVELVNRFGMTNTILFYSNKKLEEAVNREQFKKELGSQYIEAVSQEEVTDKAIINGRLTADVIKSHIPSDFIKQAKFFMCGSPGFMAGISATLQEIGVSKDRILAEEFSL